MLVREKFGNSLDAEMKYGGLLITDNAIIETTSESLMAPALEVLKIRTSHYALARPAGCGLASSP